MNNGNPIASVVKKARLKNAVATKAVEAIFDSVSKLLLKAAMSV